MGHVLSTILNYIENREILQTGKIGEMMAFYVHNKILDNTKIIGNFPDWENRGNDEKLIME